MVSDMHDDLRNDVVFNINCDVMNQHSTEDYMAVPERVLRTTKLDSEILSIRTEGHIAHEKRKCDKIKNLKHT